MGGLSGGEKRQVMTRPAPPAPAARPAVRQGTLYSERGRGVCWCWSRS